MKKQSNKHALLIIPLGIINLFLNFLVVKHFENIVNFFVAVYGICTWVGIAIFMLVFGLPNEIANAINNDSPEVLSGEFPFEIVYSIDGETFEYRDTFVCECRVDDAQHNEYSMWEESYKYNDDNTIHSIDGKKVRIDCGNAKYYLLSEKPYIDYTPGQYIYYDNNELTQKEAKEVLGLEIISTKFSEPNTSRPIKAGAMVYWVSILALSVILVARFIRRKARIYGKTGSKKIKLIVITVIAVVFSIPAQLLCFICVAVLLSMLVFLFIPIVNLMLETYYSVTVVAPEIPEIQYAEFPFEIVYSIDGEVYEINDAYVCEYKGIDWRFEKKVLDWATYFKYSDTEYIELCDTPYDYRICLYAGSPEYYMLGDDDQVPGEYLHYSYSLAHHLTAEEAEEEYGLEIISATFSEPIENELEYRTVDNIRLFIYDTFGIPVD